MRFTLVIGRLTIFDFTLFEIKDPNEDPDVIVVHHHEDEGDSPNDLFKD